MRKVIVIILSILIIMSCILLYVIKNNKTNNIDMTNIIEKQKELDKIMMDNKEKVEKYEDINKCNKEIIKYLNK